jgi:hypothetical protein
MPEKELPSGTSSQSLARIGHQELLDPDVVESDNQYCIITRSAKPTTRNDKARWEKIQHKFTDMCSPDGSWGIAFLNEAEKDSPGLEGLDAAAGVIGDLLAERVLALMPWQVSLR